MLLKVGELAKSTGMTVRTLHHYDAIGLLSPSGRTDAGYRLYNREDVARLHAIQALRQIGLPLNEVGNLLSGNQEPLPLVIQRQIAMLELQIRQASELCDRLRLVQSRVADGAELEMADWLSMLSSMSAYGKYFNATELKKIFDNWKLTEARWQPLIAEIRVAMARNAAPDSNELQLLARRWMDLSVRWMGGDFELMRRWQKMYLQEPAAKGRIGVEPELILYINRAVEVRLAALLKYFTQDDLERLNVELDDEWTKLIDDIKKCIGQKASLTGKKAQDLVCRFDSLIDRTTNHDPLLRQKFMYAYRTDATLQAGSFFVPETRDFIYGALQARELFAKENALSDGLDQRFHHDA